MDTFIILLIIVLVLVYIYDKTYLEGFVSNNTNKLIIFVSKSCPHCITYNNNVHPQIVKFCSENRIELERIFSDEDKENQFDMNNIQYVPAAMFFRNNKSIKVNQITVEGIKNLI